MFLRLAGIVRELTGIAENVANVREIFYFRTVRSGISQLMNVTTTSPFIPFETLVRAIGTPARCAILGVLSDGQPRMVNEIARLIGRKPVSVSKQLGVLRRAGLVVVNRRLYQVPAQYIAAAEKRHLDFGHCLLRLPDEKGMPTL
jgi:predicted transcriptional regulator